MAWCDVIHRRAQRARGGQAAIGGCVANAYGGLAGGGPRYNVTIIMLIIICMYTYMYIYIYITTTMIMIITIITFIIVICVANAYERRQSCRRIRRKEEEEGSIVITIAMCIVVLNITTVASSTMITIIVITSLKGNDAEYGARRTVHGGFLPCSALLSVMALYTWLVFSSHVKSCLKLNFADVLARMLSCHQEVGREEQEARRREEHTYIYIYIYTHLLCDIIVHSINILCYIAAYSMYADVDVDVDGGGRIL